MNSLNIDFAEQEGINRTERPLGTSRPVTNAKAAQWYDSHEKRINTNHKKRRVEKTLQYIVIIILGSAALTVSVLSAIHLVKWFRIGDGGTFASITAGTFEFLAIASMISIIELRRLPGLVVFLIWCIIIILVGLQINGNAFHVFNYIQSHRELVETAAVFYWSEPGPGFERFLAYAIGAPFPIMSMFFVKILSSYWLITQGITVKQKKKVKRAVV